MFTKLPRHLTFIISVLTKRLLPLVALLSVALFFVSPTFTASLLVGVIFSYVSFYQFVASQVMILAQKSKSIFFIRYVSRFLIYLLPLSIALWNPQYFNFPIILISLFSYQIAYVLFEVFRSYKKYKRRR